MSSNLIPAWFSQAYLACDLQPLYLFDHHHRPGWRTRRSRRASYSLYVVTAGSLRCMVKDKVLMAGPGDCLLLQPGVVWAEDGGLHGGGTRLMIADILVKAGVAMDPLMKLPLPLVCRLDPAAVQFAQNLADRLSAIGRVEVIRRCHEGVCLEVRTAVVALMDATIAGLFHDHGLVVAPASWPPAVHAAWACIEQRSSDEHLNVAVIAKAAKVSTSRLAALCQQYFQDSPWNMVVHRRLARAHKLLTDEPHLPLTDVASRCGWNDVRWFRRAYQRQYGTSPRVRGR